MFASCTCTLQMCMHTNTVTLANICACKQVCMQRSATKHTQISQKLVHLFPFILALPFYSVRGADSAASHPALRTVGVSHFRHTFPSPGHCHGPGPTEQRGFKQERQHLSVRLACPRRHMPSPAHVTACLEVPVEVH